MLSHLRAGHASSRLTRQYAPQAHSQISSYRQGSVNEQPSTLSQACPPSSARVPQRGRSAVLSITAQAAPTKELGSTVRMIIQGRHLKVTDAIKSYVEEKVYRAVHNFQHVVQDVHVTLSVRGGDTGTLGPRQQRVEVTIRMLRNGIVRVEDTEHSLYAAVDLVCDKIFRKLLKVKEKAIQKGKWTGRARPKGAVDEEQDYQTYKQEVLFETRVSEEAESLDQQFAELNKAYPAAVRRTKILELEPISVDDAIEAMEAVGHDFYIFRELETDEIQVLYERDAEGYGVLIPTRKE